MSDAKPLNDGRSAAFALKLAKAFHGAVPRPHQRAKIYSTGYSSASFEVAAFDEENGLPNGRFAKVTIEITRDPERREALRREIEGAGA